MDESLRALTVTKTSFQNSLPDHKGRGAHLVGDSTASQPGEYGLQLNEDVVEKEVALNMKALRRAHKLSTPTTPMWMYQVRRTKVLQIQRRYGQWNS